MIVTSNKPFGRWGEVFDDDVVAAAMIDRLVHHAEVVALKRDSYRLVLILTLRGSLEHISDLQVGTYQ